MSPRLANQVYALLGSELPFNCGCCAYTIILNGALTLGLNALLDYLTNR